MFSSVHSWRDFGTIFGSQEPFKKLLGSQANKGKPELAPVRGLLEGFSQLVSDFIEAKRNFT
jgi:hypothetical protein